MEKLLMKIRHRYLMVILDLFAIPVIMMHIHDQPVLEVLVLPTPKTTSITREGEVVQKLLFARAGPYLLPSSTPSSQRPPPTIPT